jgi:hypothetical protein
MRIEIAQLFALRQQPNRAPMAVLTTMGAELSVVVLSHFTNGLRQASGIVTEADWGTV